MRYDELRLGALCRGQAGRSSYGLMCYVETGQGGRGLV